MSNTTNALPGTGSDGLTVTSIDLGVQCVHLVSGEDVVGHAFAEQDGVSVESPVMPNIGSPDGKSWRIGLLPIRPFVVADKVFIATPHILWLAPVNQQMSELYRQFHSDIKIASPADLPGNGKIVL